MKRKLINRLEHCAKRAASSATQCISASQNAVQYSLDRQTKEQLLQDCRSAADMIPRLVNGVKNSLQNPDEPTAQLGLIEAAEQFVEPGTHVSSSARAFYPTVDDSEEEHEIVRQETSQSKEVNIFEVSDQKEERERKKDKQKLKARKENDVPMAMLQNQEPAKKRSKLVLPEPQISDQELQQVVKLGRASEIAKEVASESGIETTDALLADYSIAPQIASTPRTPAPFTDRVMQEVSNSI